MATRVHVLGSYHSDFARNVSKDSAEPLFDLLNEAAHGCLADAAVPAGDVQTAHVANLAAELFTGQAHLGAMVPALDPAWTSLPTSRHEAACASGSVAVLAAMAEIEAGRYEVALVLGVELMRGVDGVTAAQHLGCAAWLGRDEFGNELPWPWAFDRIAEEVEARSGLDRSHLARIAEINRANARRNPLAQTRAWTSNPGDYADDDVSNPVVSGRTRRSDCGRITDGSAAVLLAGDATPPSGRAAGTGHSQPTSAGGVTAPERSPSPTSSPPAKASPTCCRTCAPPSPTPTAGQGSAGRSNSTRWKPTTASPSPSTWRSTTSASRPLGRRGRRWKAGSSRPTVTFR